MISPCGPTRTSGDVRFSAAHGGKADIGQHAETIEILSTALFSLGAECPFEPGQRS